MPQTLFTTPVGRIVLGSLYKANTTDAEGKPLVVKNGANAGQPRVQFFFALAIKKGTETHWSQTTWGAEIWRKGHEAFPQAANSPQFAWKIEDGDSTVPNKRGRKPCDNEGWPGHWVVKLSGGFAPKIYRQEGTAFLEVSEVDFVKPGSFVEVRAGVDGNGSQSQPGVYLNYQMICFRAYGPEIFFGPSVEEAGFGASPLPAGASAMPPASTVPMPAAPAPIPVTPNPAFLQVPVVPTIGVAAPPAPVPPAPAPPSSGPQMTAKAGGVSYAAMVAAGWTDDAMRANGYLA